jgi:transposase
MAAPWVVSDELWLRIEPLRPKIERRFRYPGRKRQPDRKPLQGIVFVLHSGIAWRHLPPELASAAARLVTGAWMSGSGPACGSGCTSCCLRTARGR